MAGFGPPDVVVTVWTGAQQYSTWSLSGARANTFSDYIERGQKKRHRGYMCMQSPTDCPFHPPLSFPARWAGAGPASSAMVQTRTDRHTSSLFLLFCVVFFIILLTGIFIFLSAFSTRPFGLSLVLHDRAGT